VRPDLDWDLPPNLSRLEGTRNELILLEDLPSWEYLPRLAAALPPSYSLPEPPLLLSERRSPGRSPDDRSLESCRPEWRLECL